MNVRVCVCLLTPLKLCQQTLPNLHKLRRTAWKASFTDQKSPSYCCSGVLLPLLFFSFARDSHISNYRLRLLTFPCSDHAPNHRSVLIFFCTLPILFTCTEEHALWWSLSNTKLLASLFIWSTVAGSTDMTQPLMDHCHGPLPSFTGPAIGVEALSLIGQCLRAGAEKPAFGGLLC